jgi:hypothetical protein
MDLICRKSASSVIGRDAASGLDTVVAIQPPSVGLLKLYAKGSLIANQKQIINPQFIFPSLSHVRSQRRGRRWCL